jgi:hypothetical protein
MSEKEQIIRAHQLIFLLKQGTVNGKYNINRRALEKLIEECLVKD